jgi:hypothetical protein
VPFLIGLSAGGIARLAPRDGAAGAAYLVLLSSIASGFVDMMMWLVSALAAVLFNALLVRLYIRRGTPE